MVHVMPVEEQSVDPPRNGNNDPSWELLQHFLSALQSQLEAVALGNDLVQGCPDLCITSDDAAVGMGAGTCTFSLLPPQYGPKRKTLVLDLDLTLIECLVMQSQGSCDPDFIYTDWEGCRAQVWKRPHLKEFLRAVRQDFEVVLFTAAGQRHADAVLSVIDPDGTLFEHRLYGHHTVPSLQWSWVKDLARLGRDLSQVVIVDDCEAAALFQRQNWISIRPFRQSVSGWRNDRALLDILGFLQDKVLPADDVRTAISKHYSQKACRPRQLPSYFSSKVQRPHQIAAEDDLLRTCLAHIRDGHWPKAVARGGAVNHLQEDDTCLVHDTGSWMKPHNQLQAAQAHLLNGTSVSGLKKLPAPTMNVVADPLAAAAAALPPGAASPLLRRVPTVLSHLCAGSDTASD